MEAVCSNQHPVDSPERIHKILPADAQVILAKYTDKPQTAVKRLKCKEKYGLISFQNKRIGFCGGSIKG
jgi:hypothetical protein